MATDPFEPSPSRNHCQRRIRWLIAAHVAAMCALLAMKWIGLSSEVDLAGGLEFAQVTLLAIWFALGRGRWPSKMLKSLFCVAIVATASEIVSGRLSLLRSGFYAEILCVQAMLTATAWLTAAGGLAVAKRWGPKFEMVAIDRSFVGHSIPQFSLRNLLVATLISACVLAIARLIRVNFDPQHVENVILIFCFFAPMMAIYSGLAAVAYVWAGLGVSYLPLRIAAAVLLQLALVLLMSFTFSRKWDGHAFSLQLVVQFMLAAVVIGSLLVIRSCGYRVVSRSVESAEQPPLGTTVPVPHPLD